MYNMLYNFELSIIYNILGDVITVNILVRGLKQDKSKFQNSSV